MKAIRKLGRRGLSLFLVLAMCLSLMQLTVFAEENGVSSPADVLDSTESSNDLEPRDEEPDADIGSGSTGDANADADENGTGADADGADTGADGADAGTDDPDTGADDVDTDDTGDTDTGDGEDGR